ncbi:MAG: hypothetical protein AAFY71_18065 [Bacteroidota bacterium]
MDLITILWVLFTGGLGMYLGLDSLFRGEITLSAAQRWNLPACRRPSFLFYLLSTIFLLSGTALVVFSFVQMFG